jgi:hypothetical protein
MIAVMLVPPRAHSFLQKGLLTESLEHGAALLGIPKVLGFELKAYLNVTNLPTLLRSQSEH